VATANYIIYPIRSCQHPYFKIIVQKNSPRFPAVTSNRRPASVNMSIKRDPGFSRSCYIFDRTFHKITSEHLLFGLSDPRVQLRFHVRFSNLDASYLINQGERPHKQTLACGVQCSRFMFIHVWDILANYSLAIPATTDNPTTTLLLLFSGRLLLYNIYVVSDPHQLSGYRFSCSASFPSIPIYQFYEHTVKVRSKRLESSMLYHNHDDIIKKIQIN